jgi:hypothetical protein
VLAQTLGSPIAVRVESGSGLAAVMADRGQLFQCRLVHAGPVIRETARRMYWPGFRPAR